MNDALLADTRSEALLRHLEWTVLRRLDGWLQGDHRTLWRGTGLDLADLREYQLHDDVRHIDWNVTARLQQPYVRQFTEDKELSAWFLVDLSGSVDFGSGEHTKRRIARTFTAVMARLLTRHGNRVGAILYEWGANAVLPTRGGRPQVLNILQRMAPTGQAPLPPAKAARRNKPSGHSAWGETRLADLLQAAERVIRRRSTVFVVSDFISEPGWERGLGRLAQRHDVTAIRLYDALELDMPDLGMVTMQDAETGEQLVVNTHDPGFRQRFAAAALRRDSALRESLGRAGVDTLELATDEDLLEALMRFTELRGHRSRQRPGRGVPPHVSPSRRSPAEPSPSHPSPSHRQEVSA